MAAVRSGSFVTCRASSKSGDVRSATKTEANRKYWPSNGSLRTPTYVSVSLVRRADRAVASPPSYHRLLLSDVELHPEPFASGVMLDSPDGAGGLGEVR